MNSKGIMRTSILCVYAITLLAVLFPASAELPQHVHLQNFAPLDEESFREGDAWPLQVYFGAKVAVRDGLAFIGMPAALTTGRVAVFTQTTSGWTRTATITASDMTSQDSFGHTLSFRNGLLIVGSNRAVYVYKRVNGVWREQQKLVPPAADGARFASDLKHEAGVLAVGAIGNDTTRDSVYVFEQDATGKFVRRARIRASDGHLGDRFGTAISMTNAIIVVGAQWHSQARGAAYIFGRNSNGNWVQRQRLVRVESQINDLFGGSVAVDRGMILVGAPGARPPELDPERQSGVVYGFLPGTTQYLESFRLHPPEGLEAFEFGLSIAMFDKYIAVGAARLVEFFDPGDAVVSTYSRDGSSVLPLGIVPRTPNSTSISIANNLLLVGSPYDGGECTDRGDCRGQANLYHLNRFAP